MIVRQWTGIVLAKDAPDYLALMESVAIPDYRAIPGNLGAFCLHVSRGQVSEISMLTLWIDQRSIEAFAGENIEIARYYDFDDRFLLWKEAEVTHRHVFAAAGVETLGADLANQCSPGLREVQ